jgi:putative transport protein
LTTIAALSFELAPTVAAGMYAGSLTNTPALAAVLETVRLAAPADQMELLLTQPVIGYSVAYPMGAIGAILVLYVLQRLWRIDYPAEARGLTQYNVIEQELFTRSVRVTHTGVTQKPLAELKVERGWDVVFGRLRRGESMTVVTGDVVLALGDLLTIVGTPEQVDRVAEELGEAAGERLELDRSEYDFRRIFVSNPAVVGRQLMDLHLPQDYGAIVTRVRRGDIDLLAHGSTILELGDRVRVLARREDMAALTTLFGDSYKRLSEVNLLTLNLGLALGVLLGLIRVPLPGGVSFSLGLAGGPLIVGLILGALRRTGPLVWTLPYSANLTLRQIGLIMLLAGIGLRSGYTFSTNFTASGGLSIFFLGAGITLVTALVMTVLGHKLLKIPYGLLTGMVAGMNTQPATLGFALDQAENELPNLGYALVFPVATITKIIVSQLLLIGLGRF